ncbi:DNA replication and repair protein RecR [Rubrobacter xylanophilus DSM 9941]|uniref:Recombination protein RecR n=1 Tax=Rubrobacter xylanophilus (strain DSM 9941 / JCM 11954 / NBRC 16129 / PRD-1) TaxID=266117 RepID=RECR_RUBXD|nr:recombination mediator RecR [Rubrobacter xylanophilus]Q1AYP4.1 RecName: Full=Recombination protein RecR [Rubrobacter xylanophilus DSM 9941]ABG03484.1 DNA replication and repair protein RecR [Rubrobacter xylanophilus DSM 9941]
MATYARSVERLIAELSRLPTIGPRSAQRIAFHIIRTRKEEALALAEALREVKERIRPCRRCFNLTEGEECDICRDPRRDRSVICVVEDPYDIGPIERTGEYRGLYHVLGGALSPLDGVEPEDLRIAELVERVRSEGTRELILATNPNTTGEATAMFIAQEVRELPVRVTALASGLPVGGDLEYADEVTLGRAFAGRREL